MNPNAPISPEAALPSEPQVRSSAGLSGVERIKAVAAKLTPEELAAPVNKLATVRQLVVVATCISVMLETIAETQGKPDNDQAER